MARKGEPVAFRLPIANEAHLAAFIWESFGIRIPDTRVCPHHTTPWRAFVDAYFAMSPMSIWKGSRGLAGKTFLLSLLSLVEALTLHADVNLLGGSGAQSKLGLDYIGQSMRNPRAPRHRLVGEVTHETRLTTGAKIRALMASQTSVRGPHPQRLRLDEADEIKLPILDAALGQPMSRDGVPSQVVASSTHQYADGTMTELLKRAALNGWPVHEWCFRESAAAPHGWLTEEEIVRKRSQVSAAMWAVEYELQEPSVEGRAIDQAAVLRMFDSARGEFDGTTGERIEIEGPQRGARYAHGADWARKVDFTDIGTLRVDVNPMVLVAFERQQRLPWPVMVARLDARIERFGGKACHDGTGLGDVVADLIKNAADAVMLVGRERRDILSEYVAAIEHDEIRAPLIKSIKGEHQYVTVDDLYGSGHAPDSVVMGALAYRASKLGAPGVSVAAPRTDLGPTSQTFTRRPSSGPLFDRGDRGGRK